MLNINLGFFHIYLRKLIEIAQHEHILLSDQTSCVLFYYALNAPTKHVIGKLQASHVLYNFDFITAITENKFNKLRQVFMFSNNFI